MVPLRLKKAWRWLHLTAIWCLPVRIQDQFNRRNVLDQVTEAMQKIRRTLNIAGKVVEVEERYIYLRVEDIHIFLDIEPVFNEEDPHLPCAIETDDLVIYQVAHKMLSAVVASLRVRLRISDEEDFLAAAEPSWQKISNALDGIGNFWKCCGCFCLRDTEDEKYNWQDDWPKDNGFCDFHRALASGVVFETNCQEGMEIIVATRKHSDMPFIEPKKSVIF